MKNKKWLYVLVGMIMMGMTGLTHPQQSEAAELKIVFFSSMWGAAIGGVAGAAYWALKDEDENELGKIIVRGSALGVFFGMGYGLYEMNYKNDEFVSSASEGVFHYDQEKDLIRVQPLHLASYYSLSQFSKENTSHLPLFSASF